MLDGYLLLCVTVYCMLRTTCNIGMLIIFAIFKNLVYYYVWIIIIIIVSISINIMNAKVFSVIGCMSSFEHITPALRRRTT